MHKLLSLGALGLVALSLAAGCGDEDAPRPTTFQLATEDTGRTITMAVDDTLVVSLISNPSTGFGWSLQDPLPAALRMEGDRQYVPPATKSAVVGAAGSEVFTFRAVEQGTVTLTLDYARPFEKGIPPEKTWAVAVIVQ